MLTAPFTCPFANAFGPRTSTTIKSGLADFRLSCTSQQSVSNASISWKCLTASSGGAAAVSVTCVVIVGSFGHSNSLICFEHKAGTYNPRYATIGHLLRNPTPIDRQRRYERPPLDRKGDQRILGCHTGEGEKERPASSS